MRLSSKGTLALILLVIAHASTANAQSDPTPTPTEPPPRAEEQPPRAPLFDTRPPLGLFPSTEDGLIDPRMAHSWSTAPTRWFAATTVDVGFVYLRPRLSLGYGRPFTQWFGIDINPIATSGGIGAYGGLRLEMPFFDIRVGSRYWFPFNNSYLAPQAVYDRLALERDFGTKSTLLTHEAELDVSLPAGPGNILLRGSVSYITGVPDGQFVYEPTLRIIAAPPIVWRARAGYALRLGKYSQHSIGLVADVLDVPRRDDSLTVRAGPVLKLVLSRRVEIRGSFVTTISSPDKIGLAGGDFTELGVRYRWATEPGETRQTVGYR